MRIVEFHAQLIKLAPVSPSHIAQQTPIISELIKALTAAVAGKFTSAVAPVALN
jgi:hypothetical protein